MAQPLTGAVSKRLRPSAKAVIVADGRLLVIRMRDTRDGGEWLGLPGGGQRPGETIVDALRREVAEETGLLVEPIRLIWVRELIIALRDDPLFDPEVHAIEMFFEARMVDDSGRPTEEDADQVGVAWVTAAELAASSFWPLALVGPLSEHLRGGDTGPVYLGDVD